MDSRRCPYCGERFKRLDRHLKGRVGCHGQRRLVAALALGRDLPAPPLLEDLDADQDAEEVRTPSADQAAGPRREVGPDGKVDYYGPDGRRYPRAFDPGAVAGGQPHRQGQDPTPVHPDDEEPGAAPPRRGRRYPGRKGGSA